MLTEAQRKKISDRVKNGGQIMASMFIDFGNTK